VIRAIIYISSRVGINQIILTLPCLENFTKEKCTPVLHVNIMTGSTVFRAKSQMHMTAPLTLTMTVELIGDQSASSTAFLKVKNVQNVIKINQIRWCFIGF